MMAFVCCSPVQIMRAMHMKMRYELFNQDADLFISNKCPAHEVFTKNCRKTKVFKHIYEGNTVQLGSHCLFKLMFGRSETAKIIKRQKYEKLIAFNVEDELTQALFNLNRKNKDFEYHCVEDGPGFYTIYVPPKYKWYQPAKILGWDRQIFHIKTWWTSCPELMEVPDELNTYKSRLMPIDYNDMEYINVINTIFEYKECQELNKADVLIMDESHYVDGLMVDNSDYKLYLDIKEKYPQLNFLIKMHPRTKENRYKNSFNIMCSPSIPWEVYVLNRFGKVKKDLVQISIACGSMVSDYFMFGIEGKKIVLAPMFYEKIRVTSNGVRRVTEQETINFKKIKAKYKHPENFVIAENVEDVYTALNYMI